MATPFCGRICSLRFLDWSLQKCHLCIRDGQGAVSMHRSTSTKVLYKFGAAWNAARTETTRGCQIDPEAQVWCQCGMDIVLLPRRRGLTSH